MDRRTALLALAGGGLGAARGAEVRYRPYHRCLPEFTAALVEECVRKRDAALKTAVASPDAIRRRQAWVRETFWQLIGGQPERTPLNLRTVGSFERPGYRVDRIVYESQPGLLVPANLYVPTTGKAPYPGVLFQLGHSLEGKAAEPYQKCCQGLARLGYVVLAFDPMGQGERRYYNASDADEEHSRAGRLMLLLGDTATRLQTWDAVRSLDVLASHPSVDPKRLASTGQSGGGTLTMLLAAVDDRLSSAAVSCGNTENFACPAFLPPGSTDDAEQNFVGGSPAGFERWDLLWPFAPKPLWVGASGRDYFGTYSPSYLANGRMEFARLKTAYERLGRADAISWYETAVPHALSHDLRVQIYNFFGRTLKNSTTRVPEPEVAPELAKALQAGVIGRPKNPVGRERRRFSDAGWKQALRVELPKSGLAAKTVGVADAEGCSIEGIEIESAPNVVVPAWLYLPRKGARERVMLMLEPRGRNGRWREGDLYHRLAADGWTVCAFDVRGIGDMSPEVGRGNPFYTRPHSEDEAWAWAGLMLGRPMLGQRVTDILAVGAAVRGGQRTVLAATGHTSVPAVVAALFDPNIETVVTGGGLQSWASLVEDEKYTEPFSNFVPGILAETDLPAIRESLGRRFRSGQGGWTFENLRQL